VPMVIVNMAACQVGIYFGLKGPTASPVAACATGVVAVGEAMGRLKLGYADVILAGGTESADTPLGVAAFARLGALSTRNDAPEKACRPFDLDRDGTVLGEGAVVLAMETLEHARKRRANILAEVVGYGFSGDGYHVAAPDPSGEGAARAIRGALESARLAPADLQYIAAHGTGTPLNDVSETLAIKKALGQAAYQVPISSNKPMVGHMLGAAGAFSIMVAMQTIQNGVIHPTINLEKPDPDCDLDYVPGEAREARVDVAMANAFGFGGQNASLVVRRFVS
jgi:3-oxoacyl-[acyl-carrier-protein] synthase II